ncbi:MAG TPA: tetratricopeptide repeat protein [Gemmatimonadaceae bacterium]
MPRFVDVRGLPVTAASGESARKLDAAVESYLGARSDTHTRLAEVLEHDPDFALAHCVDGYLRMLSSKREGRVQARRALARARVAAFALPPTPRETRHIDALDAWSRGDMRAAVATWGAILLEAPLDVVAIKVSQFVLSYLGESTGMRDLVALVLPSWDPGVPGYGYLLGCYAYGLEEAGDYAAAERLGRRAVELNPSDIWASHAVAHVAEMQGRRREGIAWIASGTEHWRECNNFAFHLRWHEALFRLDLEEHERVLAVYDREVRNEQTDEYLDIANAVSLLWRLEQVEVNVGDRWRELADRARLHVDDHSLVFVDLHYLMALAAVDDATGVEQFLQSCTHFSTEDASTEATVMADVGLPLARAVVAHRRGAFRKVVEELMPVRDRFRRIGASHAQRDIFEQLLIDAAWRDRQLHVARELLAERTATRPGNMWGWAHYARVLRALGSAQATTAQRALDRLRET